MGWVFPSANFAFWFKTSFSSVTPQLLLFTFHQEKKNQKRDINTFVKGTHFTSSIVCRQESPSPWPDLSLSQEPSHLHELLRWLLRPGLLAGWPAGGRGGRQQREGAGRRGQEATAGRPGGGRRGAPGPARRPAGPGLGPALLRGVSARGPLCWPCAGRPAHRGAPRTHAAALRPAVTRRAVAAWRGAAPRTVGQLCLSPFGPQRRTAAEACAMGG